MNVNQPLLDLHSVAQGDHAGHRASATLAHPAGLLLSSHAVAALNGIANRGAPEASPAELDLIDLAANLVRAVELGLAHGEIGGGQ